MSNLQSGNFPLLTYRNINLGATGVRIIAGKHQIMSMLLSNTSGGTLYVKLYDKATAPSSSDTPTHTIALPANQTIPWSPLDGIGFTLGIGIRATTGVADNNNTSPGSNEVIVNIEYL